MARGTWGGGGDPSIFKVNLLFLMGTSKCQTGFKLRDVGIQDNDANEVAAEVLTQLQAPFVALLSPQDSFLGVDVLKLGTDEGGWAPGTMGAGQWDTTVAAELPNFTSMCLNLKSEVRKRYGQGRMFLPVVNEAAVSGNTFATGSTARFDTFITAMTTHFTGDPVTHDLILVNAHGNLAARGAVGDPGYRPAVPASWYDVTSLRLNTLITSLRSRKAGVGS